MRTPLARLSAVALAVVALAAVALAVVAITAAAPLHAQSIHPSLHVDATLDDCSVRFAPELTQRAFDRFVREFGSVSAFKQAAPPSTLGAGRVLFGIDMISFRVDEWADAWNDTFYHPNDHHELGSKKEFPLLRLRAGVTDALDVGAFYTRNPHANYGWLGVDGKYQVASEAHGAPVTVAVRGAYTETLYVSDMDMHALTTDVSVGRRLWRTVHSYAGLGADGLLVRETSDAVRLRGGLTVVPHLFAGVDATVLRRVNLGAEFTASARPSVQVHVGGVAF